MHNLKYKSKNLIQELSINFSLNIIQLYKNHIEQKEYIIAKQLLRSSTSIGANLAEAQSSESKKDFIHKINISLKEARETEYWLELLAKSKITNLNYEKESSEIQAIIKILTKIIKSTKQKYNI